MATVSVPTGVNQGPGQAKYPHSHAATACPDSCTHMLSMRTAPGNPFTASHANSSASGSAIARAIRSLRAALSFSDATATAGVAWSDGSASTFPSDSRCACRNLTMTMPQRGHSTGSETRGKPHFGQSIYPVIGPGMAPTQSDTELRVGVVRIRAGVEVLPCRVRAISLQSLSPAESPCLWNSHRRRVVFSPK